MVREKSSSKKRENCHFDAESVKIEIIQYSQPIYYMYHWKLEKGIGSHYNLNGIFFNGEQRFLEKCHS